MALITPKTEADNYLASLGISLAECDICGNRFSWSMTHAWPLCDSEKKHKRMSSEEQCKKIGRAEIT